MSTLLEHITTPPFSSVADLMEVAESLLIPENGAVPVGWAFRGQPRDYGTLVPSFQREFKRQSFGAAEVIERRLIDAFRQHYVDLKDRSADMPAPENIGEHYDLRCLSVMQHYEIPTRLLDWTSDFWTAVYFACASEPDSGAELWCYDRALFGPQMASDPSLWGFLDQSAKPPPEPPFLGRREKALLIELDPKITPRMRMQSAHHTVSANVFSDHAPMLFDLNQGGPGFRRYIIAASSNGRVLQFLAEEAGITASTIFPDVVGLGRFLRWQFESLLL